MFWKVLFIGVNEWGNFNLEYVFWIKCYIYILSVSFKQRGDVILFLNFGGLGYVGIVFYGNQYISVGDKIVDEKVIFFGKFIIVW